MCFSGWTSVNNALQECTNIKAQLPGQKFLSIGGGGSSGRWSLSALNSLDNDVRSKKLSGWNGIVYDVEEGDSGLAGAFASSFANAKSNGLSVLVTISHSEPYDIPDAANLMKSFFSNPNIDYISPQLYTQGTELDNDYATNGGTNWQDYASSRAKIVPSVVLGSRDFPTALKYFSQYGITLAGYMQWTQGQGKIIFFSKPN